MNSLPRVAGVAAIVAAALLTAGPAAAKPTVLPVWAMADGDTPVAGAVRVVAGDGRVLRTAERTSHAGIALIEAEDLPDSFTVQVTPSNGLGGSFRAVVHHYVLHRRERAHGEDYWWEGTTG